MRHLTRRRVVGAAATLVSAFAGCSSGEDGPTESAAATATRTTTAESTASPSTAAPDATTETPVPRTVRFRSPADVTVESTLYPGGDCGVVLVPQINLDRGSWTPQARRLSTAGRTVLAVDEGDRKTAAVLGAVRHLRRERGVESVVLVGASSGGEAAVEAAAAADPPVAGVVGLSAGGGTDAVANVATRSLFVVSESDDDRFVETARALHRDAPDPTELVVYDGAAHGQRIFDTDHGSPLYDRLTAFVAAACD